MAAVRVLLVDDHALVRAGMRSLLKDISDVEVVAETGNGREAVELAKQHQPHIVLMDIAINGMNGLDAAARIVKDQPRCKIIIVSMHSNDEYITRALHVGVSGYLIKDAAASELEAALRAVARSEKYLSPEISTRLMDRYEERGLAPEASPEKLTPRQRETLQLIAEGHTTKEVATILGVSVKTIDTHRTQLMKRLNIHDVTGLVRYAIRTGLVSSEK